MYCVKGSIPERARMPQDPKSQRMEGGGENNTAYTAERRKHHMAPNTLGTGRRKETEVSSETPSR